MWGGGGAGCSRHKNSLIIGSLFILFDAKGNEILIDPIQRIFSS